MQRINVIGTTGSGKSTFSEALAKKLNYPCVHMDELFWKPDWQESSDEEFFPKVQATVEGERWVLDGNYSRTNDIKWRRVDTIIWLDYSYSRTLYQLLGRTVSRAWRRQELWPGTGNRESFRMSFLSKHSILLWFVQSYKRNKIRYAALQDTLADKPITLVRLTSPRETSSFINHLSAD